MICTFFDLFPFLEYTFFRTYKNGKKRGGENNQKYYTPIFYLCIIILKKLYIVWITLFELFRAHVKTKLTKLKQTLFLDIFDS